MTLDSRLLIGPHIDPPLALIPPALAGMGLTVFQTTLRNPSRLAKEGIPDEEDQAAYRAESHGLWGIVHASLITSLGSPDPRIRNGSAGALASDANLAAALGLAGVCFHVGYEKGHPNRETALKEVARKLREVLEKLKPGARVLLENGCEGTELGQTVEEVARVVELVGAGAGKLGVVLDTCHLHVAGRDLAAPDAADRLEADVRAAGLAEYLTAFHLNDAQAACGSKRDRHAAPGEGTIGEGLRRIIRQPLFATVPAILEMSIASAERGIAYLTADAQDLWDQ